MALKFGLALMNDFPQDVVPASRVAMLREQVRAARDAGIDSLWVLQHYLGGMPTLQPVHLLSALSQDAGNMKLGTNMYILPLRHPVGAAEEFSTLDHLSNGNAIAGFGMGYRENEFKSFGVPMEERVGRFEESVQLVRRLWSGERTSFEGKHFQIEDERISLVPVQPGGPPIWIGAGAHRKGAERAAKLGDAWIVPPHTSPEKLDIVLGQYRVERERLGLGPASEFVVRRELVLDPDAERSRAIGLAARNSLSREYAKYNAPDQTGNYSHLASAEAATQTADASYLFTDPASAVVALKALEAQGLTYIVLRMQWYALEQEQVLRTLELFKNEVLPSFQ
ncbi:LLM class flavin-dependent oxidoreductase [Arthrobacter sp. Marseille-P9274]|uniref:LLM class flavin-dependent oxidoreductase n=1 Tax=Arthrobacter sp. Marseille-P9274 TaxID=2866572 RepID=UPI0021C7F462|nr:LLM class flavin-dependent oxidoreductase [Arthrobacter sp. Marseille-P9274]